MCSKYYDVNNKEVNLSDKVRQNILSQEGVIGTFANECLRCVAIGYVEYKKAEWAMHAKQGLETMEQKEKLETGLKLLMITGIKDPLKEGIPKAVQDLRDAGVNTRMITGDNIKTAIAIAKEANILAHDWD
jgi:P-type E1-E2 ATPase